jgi:hypothetical protein
LILKNILFPFPARWSNGLLATMTASRIDESALPVGVMDMLRYHTYRRWCWPRLRNSTQETAAAVWTVALSHNVGTPYPRHTYRSEGNRTVLICSGVTGKQTGNSPVLIRIDVKAPQATVPVNHVHPSIFRRYAKHAVSKNSRQK